MTKKKIFLTGMFLVTLICMIVGVVFHTTDVWGRSGWGLRIGSRQTTREEVSLSGVKNLSIDLSVADLLIERGDEYTLSIVSTKRLKPEVLTDADTLTVRQRETNHFWWPGTVEECHLRITVPEDVSFETGVITSNVGDLTLRGVSFDSLSIITDVGKADIERVDVDAALKVESSVGAISLYDVVFDEGDFSADVGAVNIKDVTFRCCEIESDIGDVAVEVSPEVDLDAYTIQLETDTGDISFCGEKERKGFWQRGDMSRYLTVTSDVGSIRVE